MNHGALEAGLRVETRGGIARLTLARPDRRNPLSQELIEAIDRELATIAEDNAVRAVVIAAEGPVFSAGHDLTEMTGRSEAEYRELFTACSRMMTRLRKLPQPVIARVQGHAVAAGCQLVASCDLAVAADLARFGTPGVKIGLFCTTPMVPLVRTIPQKAALEMLLTGATVDAHRAAELGLVNRVVASDALDAVVNEWAAAILASSPLTVRIGKAAFYDGLGHPEEEAYRRASAVMTENALKADAQEGMTAFLEKRPPRWTGR